MSVVLGYDESPGAARALRAAIEVAQAFGEQLVLVYGAAPPGPTGEEYRAHYEASARPGVRDSATPSRRPRGPVCRPSSRSSTSTRRRH